MSEQASTAATSFVPGFAARHDLAGQALQRAFTPPAAGFSAASRVFDAEPTPASFAARAPGPRHFSPADRSANPTAGWNPLDPDASAPSFVDPAAAAREAGYAEGVAAARAALEEAGDRDRALLSSLLDQLAAGHAIDREAIARHLRQTVLMLVAKLVGETGVSADLLAGRIEAAAGHLADAAESALLRVHPDDVALLQDRLPKRLFAVGDAAIARGGFILESASTVVEDGPALWLEQLAHVIERVAVPDLT